MAKSSGTIQKFKGLFENMFFKLLLTSSLIVMIRAEAYQKCTKFDCSGKQACVTIYQHKNFGGWYQCIPLCSNECANFNTWWIGSGSRVSAANTHDTCVRLYDQTGCSGNYVEVKPGSEGHRNLASIGFGDVAKSVSSCKRESTATYRGNEMYEKCSRSDCSGQSACVTVYQIRNFGGWYQCLPFRNTECKNLNPWWIAYGPRVSSVNTHNTCIRLYEGLNCDGTAVEIKPGSAGHRRLADVNFDHRTRSVSACRRNTSNSNRQCYVKNLFSRSLDSTRFSDNSNNVLGRLDMIADLAVSVISLKVPGLSQIYQGIKLIVSLFVSEQDMIAALVDAKVEEAFARNTASQMSAKMRAIDNRLNTVLNEGTPEIGKRIALGNAMHTCEEIKGLFADSSFSFSRNKLVASPYLVAFSAVYLAVARLSYQMKPETRSNLVVEMGKLAKLNKEYKFESLRVRGGRVTWGVLNNKRVVEDRLVCKPGEVEGEVSSITQCYIYAVCERVRNCNSCLESVKSSVEKEIKEFFQPTIEKLEKFPN